MYNININNVYLDYCRPIVIETKMNYTLYDEQILNLTNRTISQNFLNIIENYCYSCFTSLEDNINDKYILECECIICAKCLRKKIIMSTDGKIILNEFEKGTMRMYLINPYKIIFIYYKCI